MKKASILTICCLCTAMALNAQEVRKLTILHTNDFHSHLQGYSPESAYTPFVADNDKTTGGFARIAGIISGVKEENPNSTLVVDAGDSFMGTLFHSVESKTGFQLPLFRRAGYDVVAVGNHEFDYGPEALSDIINISASKGDIPVILAGNAVTDPDDEADNKFEATVKKGLIRSHTIIERNGVKIGVFSLLGKDADDSAPYAPPVTFSKNVKTAKKLVKALDQAGCDVVICLSHSGIKKDKKGEWAGEDVDLARKVKGIDLIVSGHTHTLIEKPLFINGIPIIQTGSGGRFVGKIDIAVTGGKVTLEKYSLIPVNDDVTANMDIQKEIDGQMEVINEKILKPLKLEYNMPVTVTDYPLTCEEYGDLEASNLGPLVADAIYYYMNSEGPGVDIAMVAAGVIRDPLTPGTQSVADIFRVMSLGSGNDIVPGYPLSRLWVTGKELKSIAEILIMSSVSTPSHFCYYSHLRIEYDPDGGLFKKIQKLEFTDKDGVVSEVNTSKDDTRLYSIVANSYMLDFVGIIKKKSFGLINVIPKDAAGGTVTDMDNAVVDFDAALSGVQEGKEWIALVRYLKHLGEGSDASITKMPDYYRNPERSLVRVTPEK